MGAAATKRNRTIATICSLGLILMACGDSNEVPESEAAADPASEGTTSEPEPSEDGDQEQTDTDDSIDCEAYYAGQNVEFSVGYGVGGYDRYARMIEPYLSDELGANVQVRNIEGAGGNLQVAHVYDAEPDGFTIGLVNGAGSTSAQIAGDASANFDLTEMSWVGRLAWEPAVVTVNADGPIENIEDLIAQDPPVFGTQGAGGAAYLQQVVMRETIVGMEDMEIVTGIEAPEIELGIQRGDIDAMSGNWDSRYVAIEAGQQKAVLTNSFERIDAPGLSDIPTILEIDRFNDDESRAAVEAMLVFDQLGRPIAAPPGVEAGVLGCLRDAVERALTNPELIEEGQEEAMPINYMSGEEFAGTVDSLINDLNPRFAEILESAF